MSNPAGWERVFKHGPYGTQAPNAVTKARNIKYGSKTDYADTSSGGDGTTVPHADNRPAFITPTLTFNMIRNTTDTILAALLAAARNTTPTPVALYYKDYSAGKGVDWDFYVTVEQGSDYKGEATYDFEAVGTSDGGRDHPVLNAA